ncbi:MAG: hypothetical protein AAB719_00895 [Patescibacteria group bacterium]
MPPQNNQSNAQPSGSSNKTLMGILSYLGPLVIVPFLMSKDDSFVKFHIKQGLVVFCLSLVAWIFGSVMYSFYMVVNVINLATFVLSVMGIVHVVQKNEKELPLVGGLAKYFTF